MKIAKALIVVAIVIVLLLASLLLFDLALSVPITYEEVQEAHRDGMIEGCIEMFISIAGPPPSNAHRLALVQACVAIANGVRLDVPMLEPVVPQDVPLPTVLPGSWM